MPFPVLNKTDFSRTGAYLSPEEYFNPAVNPEFHDSLPSYASRGTLKLKHSLWIAQNLLTEESLVDVLTYSCRYASGNANPETIAITKWFYNELPEDKKWLVFFTKVSYVQESPSRHLQYRISLRYPERISYSESVTDLWIIGTFLTIVHNQMTGIPELTAESMSNFRAELPAVLERIVPFFDPIS